MATLTVGSGAQYSTISAAVAAANSGDTIDVDAGTYTNDFPSISQSLTLQAVGGTVYMNATQDPPNGKAIIDEGGSGVNVTINGFDLSGAQVPDGNGAGIRYEGGSLTLNNDTVHNNQDGLLSNPDPNGTITINSSTFTSNGAGDGYTHNIYVGDINSLTVQNSTIDAANVGHDIKSRAQNTTISNNTIEDGPNGNSSYEIDLPNGGNADIQGNTIEKGPNAQNPSAISFGEEGGVYGNSSLTVQNNTMINDDPAGDTNAVVNDTGATATITGNSLFGWSTVALGPANVSGNTLPTTESALSSPAPGGAVPAAGLSDPAAPTPTPTPTPAPTPTPTPVVTQGGTFGSSADTLTANLAEDAYQGDAQANISIDGQLVTPTPITVTASQAAGDSEAFNFQGNFGAGQHTIAVSFLNDAYGGSPALDRNLYVDGLTLDGNASPDLASGPFGIYTTSTDQFSVSGGTPAPTPAPTPTPAPAQGDTLTLGLSEDAWQGDAQFIATLDGQQLGPAQSVTASNAAGQVQDFTYQGNFGVGPHDLAVTFLNDAWGGTSDMDRNLYVDSVNYDGTAVPNGSAALYSNGTVHIPIPALAGS